MRHNQKSKSKLRTDKVKEYSDTIKHYPEELPEYLRQMISSQNGQEKKERREKIRWIIGTALTVVGICLACCEIALMYYIFESLDMPQLEISQQNQEPSISIEAQEQDDKITGYYLVNSGGIMTELDIRLERLIRFDSWSDNFYIPYNEVAMYIPNSLDMVFFDLHIQDEHADNNILYPLATDDFTDALIDTLENKSLKYDEGYLLRTLDILTLSFTDYTLERQTKKYVVYSENDSSGDLEKTYCLHPLSDDDISSIEAEMLKNVDRHYNLDSRFYSPIQSKLYMNAKDQGYYMEAFSYSSELESRERNLIDGVIKRLGLGGAKQ